MRRMGVERTKDEEAEDTGTMQRAGAATALTTTVTTTAAAAVTATATGTTIPATARAIQGVVDAVGTATTMSTGSQCMRP